MIYRHPPPATAAGPENNSTARPFALPSLTRQRAVVIFAIEIRAHGSAGLILRLAVVGDTSTTLQW